MATDHRKRRREGATLIANYSKAILAAGVESFEQRGDAVDRHQYDTGLLALIGGIYVGYITYSIFTYDSAQNPEVCVQMVEVLEGYRRRGVATALYDEMVDKVSVGYPQWDGEVLKSLQTEDGSAFFSMIGARR